MRSLNEDDEAYCRWLSRYFFVEGYAPEDLAQEARIAMLCSPRFKRRAARLRILDLLKMSQRRPRYGRLVHEPAGEEDVCHTAEEREFLRCVLSEPRTENERRAVGMALRGEPIPRDEKALQVALWRTRRRLRGLAPAQLICHRSQPRATRSDQRRRS